MIDISMWVFIIGISLIFSWLLIKFRKNKIVNYIMENAWWIGLVLIALMFAYAYAHYLYYDTNMFFNRFIILNWADIIAFKSLSQLEKSLIQCLT